MERKIVFLSMQHIQGISRHQLQLSSLEDKITADNLVWFTIDCSRTRKVGWAIAQSPILSTTITLKRLKQRGYQSLTDVYIELNPSLCEPPST